MNRLLSAVQCCPPFKTVGGATKADAFQKCAAAEDPTPKCGTPKAR